MIRWDTRLLCIVICLLFASDLSETERLAISCFLEQSNDLHNYAESASLDYKTYETKWGSLHSALLEILTTSSSKSNYECKRLIQSFAKEPIQVSMSLIEKLKEKKNMTEQIKMAIEYKVSGVFSIDDDAVVELKGAIEDDTMDNADIDVQIIQGLQDLNVKESETLTLECKFTKPGIAVKWLKNQRELVPNNRSKIISRDCSHTLIVDDISEEDSAVYTCTAGNVKSECYVHIEVLAGSFSTKLQETNVYENEKVVLTCQANSEDSVVQWYKCSDRLIATNNILFSKDGRRHCLEILAASREDTGIYSCQSLNGKVLTSAFVIVKELPRWFTSNLQNVDVFENQKIVLECELNVEKEGVKWFKSSDRLEETGCVSFRTNGRKHYLEIASACPQDTGTYACLSGDTLTSAYVNVKELPVEFIDHLTDTDVCEGDDIMLTCEVNVLKKTATWFHDDKEIQHSSVRRRISSNGKKHSLTILNATLYDDGKYRVAFGEVSSVAVLTVNEQQPVEFISHLTDTDVTEGDDITLKCKVNVLKKTATWFHDDKEIQHSSVRRSSTSNGKEHSLTILNAKLYDDGNYRVEFGEVSSVAVVTVNDTTSNLHKQQLTKQNYRNWVRGALSLLYLKQGLTEFTNKSMKKQHYDFLQKLQPTPTAKCTHCNLETLMPFKHHANNKTCHKNRCLCLKKPISPHERALCPNGGFCSKLYDLILAEHRYADLCLTNADIPAWISDPWSVGTCFINTPGYKNKKSAKKIDCSGLLSVVINDKFFNAELGDVRINGISDLFKQARDARNDILHNANYELSSTELTRYIDLFKNVLEVRNVANKKPLEHKPGVPEALQNLDRLQRRQIDIDEEVNRSTKITGEQELADIYEKAKKKAEEKVKTLEESLKEKEEQIKLLRQVRRCEQQDQKTEFEVVFDLTIIVSGSTAEKAKIYNNKILDSVKHALQLSDRQNPSTSTSDSTMETETLVDVLVKIPGVKISLADESVLIMKISVTSYHGLNGFLTLMNGEVLRQKLFQLRKCVEKDTEESVVVDARITSGSFNDTKIHLSTANILNDKDGDFKCKIHPWMQDAWYCTGHGEFFCTTCKANEHSSCEGVKTVIPKMTGPDESLLTVKGKKEYNVRTKADKEVCFITGICILPTQEILLVDNVNKRLKKLDRSFKHLASLDLRPCWKMCYTGNGVVAVDGLQFVEVSGKLKSLTKKNVRYECSGLACHGETLYAISEDRVYEYKRDGTNELGLYISQSFDDFFSSIDVSDDGEKIYIAAEKGGLVTIDNKGNHLATLNTYVQQTDQKHESIDVRFVCIAGDGTVFIHDRNRNSVIQVDYEGRRILQHYQDILEPQVASIGFDRHHGRLIVALEKKDTILVLDLQ